MAPWMQPAMASHPELWAVEFIKYDQPSCLNLQVTRREAVFQIHAGSAAQHQLTASKQLATYLLRLLLRSVNMIGYRLDLSENCGLWHWHMAVAHDSALMAH